MIGAVDAVFAPGIGITPVALLPPQRETGEPRTGGDDDEAHLRRPPLP